MKSDYLEPEELIEQARQVLSFYRSTHKMATDLARQVLTYFDEKP